jgi:predicted DNA binding CopG/RHH family protein
MRKPTKQTRESKPKKRTKETAANYYDRRGILGELEEGEASFAIEQELRREILEGRRARRLKNVTVKLDPVHVQALRKIATQRAIPYQTRIRQWLAEGIRRELELTGG